MMMTMALTVMAENHSTTQQVWNLRNSSEYDDANLQSINESQGRILLFLMSLAMNEPPRIDNIIHRTLAKHVLLNH